MWYSPLRVQVKNVFERKVLLLNIQSDCKKVSWRNPRNFARENRTRSYLKSVRTPWSSSKAPSKPRCECLWSNLWSKLYDKKCLKNDIIDGKNLSLMYNNRDLYARKLALATDRRSLAVLLIPFYSPSILLPFGFIKIFGSILFEFTTC